MHEERSSLKRVKKTRAKLLLWSGMPILLVVVPMLIIFIMIGSVLPSAAEGVVQDYKSAAMLVGCTWQELIVYDTVRFENELEGVDPYVSALDFLKVDYEVYRQVTKDHHITWVFDYGGLLNTPEEIKGFFGVEASTISEVLDTAKGFQKPKYVINFIAKELDDLILEKSFTQDQVEWVDALMADGLMEEMFGDIYEMPDYIISSGTGYFGWPTPELHTVTSQFNAHRVHPVLGYPRPHNGVDISGGNAMGSPACAIDDGVVIQVNLRGGERGINIRVQHNIGSDVWISRYQHLSAVNVAVGDQVVKGTVIGTVGNTGIGTGAHLHLELTFNGVLLDPLPLIQ